LPTPVSGSLALCWPSLWLSNVTQMRRCARIAQVQGSSARMRWHVCKLSLPMESHPDQVIFQGDLIGRVCVEGRVMPNVYLRKIQIVCSRMADGRSTMAFSALCCTNRVYFEPSVISTAHTLQYLLSANSERGKINSELHMTLRDETADWGLEIVRTELKEIDPPRDVQETMNKVVKAENEKVAAIDFATATETMADGARRAKIKEAEGIRQANILAAEGEAQAIKLVNEAADRYFVGNAQLLRKLETVERSLARNSKIVIPADSELVNVIGELAGVLPLAKRRDHAEVVAGRAAQQSRQPAV
jgi:hypothetical protein